MKNILSICVLIIFCSCSNNNKEKIIKPLKRNIKYLSKIEIISKDYTYNTVYTGGRFISQPNEKVTNVKIDYFNQYGYRYKQEESGCPSLTYKYKTGKLQSISKIRLYNVLGGLIIIEKKENEKLARG